MLKIKKEFQDLIPPLNSEEYSQLEKNCIEDGIRDKIIIWDDYIVDGHNRFNIAEKHNLKYETEEIALDNEEDVKVFIINLQLGRRNLVEFVKIELLQIRKEILKALGKEKMSSGGKGLSTIDKPSHNTRETLSKELNISSGKLAQAEVVIKKADEKTKEKLRSGEVSINNVYQEIKKEEKKEDVRIERQKLSEIGKTKKIDIDFRLGDFEEVFKDIKDGSIDCIITDPPYPLEFIDCYSKLSRFAKRVLKPNGFCIAYAGHINLPEVTKRMSEHLTFYWIFCMHQPGVTKIVQPRKIMASWKPILIYQNGFKQNSKVIRDYFTSEQMEKDGHDWQQSISGVAYLVEMFTKPGDLVLEPFAGSGTTIKVCIDKGRKIIASEIDEDTYNIAKAKL